jgi:hypothetical protein
VESLKEETTTESSATLQEENASEPTEDTLDKTSSETTEDAKNEAKTDENRSTAAEKSTSAQSVFSMPDEGDELVVDEDDDSLEIEKARIKSLKNVKRRSIRLSLVELDDADGYEISIVKANKNTLKKLKKQLRNGDKISVAGLKKAHTQSTAVQIKKLKKNTTYYVLVRGYANVDNKKIYGEYSEVKKVTVRR